MNVLAIDTATDKAMVSLLVGDKWGQACQDGVKTHAEFVLPMICQLLSESGIELSMLDAIAFGCGPGSFTGLRIATAIVKGLAYAHDTKLYPIDSFAAIFEQAQQAGPLLGLMDARMSELYWQYKDKEGRLSAIQVTKAEDIIIDGDDKIIAVGVGFEPYLRMLPPDVQARIKMHESCYPNTDAMIRLVLKGAAMPVTIDEALPLYIRNQVTQGAPRG